MVTLVNVAMVTLAIFVTVVTLVDGVICCDSLCGDITPMVAVIGCDSYCFGIGCSDWL